METAQEELDEAKEEFGRLLSTGGGDELDGDAQEEAISEAGKAVKDAESSLEAAQEAFWDIEDELAELEELEREISDFRHGETMIPVGDFENYAQEYANDIGAIGRNASWPLNYIDWEQAASELQMDYTEVSYQGESYYVRS